MTPTARDDAVETVRARTDIVELIGRYLKLKKVGSRYVGLCPFHAEKTPSFSVNPQKGFFHCFGCKASGDAFTFLMRMDGKTFPEALEDLATRAGVELPARRAVDPEHKERKRRQLELLERATDFYESTLWRSAVGRTGRAYLETRALPEPIARRFRLGFAPPDWQAVGERLGGWEASADDGLAVGLLARGKRGPFDLFRNRLVFPILGLDERVHGFGARKMDADEPGGKYINSPQGPLFDKSEMLYGLVQARRAIQRSGQALLVEGYFDVLSLVAAGVEEAVATCGTALTEGHARLLKRFCERVVTAFDADEAGLKASFRAAEVLQAQDISPYMLAMPAGEDPDSFVRTRGASAMAELLKRARPSVEVLSDRLALEAGDDVEARTRAVRKLLPLLKACRDRVRQGTYLQLVAERFRLAERDLRAAVGDASRVGRPAAAVAPGTGPARRAAPAASTDELRLLALLLQHPGLAGEVIQREALADVHSQAVRLAAERIASAPQTASPATVVAEMEDPTAGEWISAELVRAGEPNLELARADLELVLRKLRNRALHEQKRELERLIEQSARRGNREEQRTLLAAKLNLDREIEALGLAVKRVP